MGFASLFAFGIVSAKSPADMPEAKILYFLKIFLDFLCFLEYNMQADKLIKAYLSKHGDVA